MPACVPVHNDVGDINANKKPPSQTSESKLSKIITCLFWRKKTDVVDMTKESPAVKKKQQMAVDRSERSRRVLKMESMRAAPLKRDETDVSRTSSQGAQPMFLPSENPTASFLSNLNPSVRRACSEVIRTASVNSNSNAMMTREAFADNRRIIHTRNTNYRGQRVTDGSSKRDGLGKPPKPPERHSSCVREKSKPVIVPGIMSSSDDDVGYNSDNDITDLHDEMRRMNISHPDARNSADGRARKSQRRRREADANLTDEGSISLSEDDGDSEGNADDEGATIDDRPQNPSPGRPRDKHNDDQYRKEAVPKVQTIADEEPRPLKKRTKSMEDVIDDMFTQTQCNIDNIYRNGLENLEEIETYRSDTMTPDTYMNKLVQGHTKPTKDLIEIAPIPNKDTKQSKHGNSVKVTTAKPKPGNNSANMDNLLSEVSIWAQDRQKWLLEDGKLKVPEGLVSRESTAVSVTTDGHAIKQVSTTNTSKDRCSNWVCEQTKMSDPEHSEHSRVAGILTGPKLFRSSSKNSSHRHVSFGESDRSSNKVRKPVHIDERSEKVVTPGNRTPDTKASKSAKILQLIANETTSRTEDIDKDMQTDPDKCNIYPEPWTYDMYASACRTDMDRSTLNDDLSELDDKVGFRARSPGSWLSSNGSCSHLMKERDMNNDDANDCFEVPRGINDTPDYAVKSSQTDKNSTPGNVIKASNSGRSHQILRQAPKIHAPFREKQGMPLPTTPAIPNRNIHKNTQLKPLSSLRQTTPRSNLEAFPALPGMKGPTPSHSFHTSRNMGEFDNSNGKQAMRPFSEIPLSTTDLTQDKNSNLLVNNYSVPQGPDSSHPFIQSMMRPYSETTATKRTGQVGMGPIMATKDRQTYARDIINAIEKGRIQPQMDAFHVTVPTAGEAEHKQISDIKEEQDEEEKSSENGGKKRHKVFNNNLIRGGYSYDKHSRRKHEHHKNSQSFSGLQNHGDTPHVAHSMSFQSPQHSTLTTRSETNYRSCESTLGSGQNTVITHNDISKHAYQNGYVNTPSSSAKSDQTDGGFNTTINRSTSLQNHSQGSAGSRSNTSGELHMTLGTQHTANKFRKLRTRRDQEMDWLMRDAAETEV